MTAKGSEWQAANSFSAPVRRYPRRQSIKTCIKSAKYGLSTKHLRTRRYELAP